MNFDELIGEELKFYGVDNNRFCLKYGGRKTIFEAIEDENDGYRSCLGAVEIRPEVDKSIFYQLPVATMLIRLTHLGPTCRI